MRGRGKSIAEDLRDFLKKHIVPLKKGEILRAKENIGVLVGKY
jgi:hypothetical protein